MKREYYIYEGVYYALVKVKGDNFKDGDAIFEVVTDEIQPQTITRLNFADANAEFKKGKSEHSTIIPWVGKWNSVTFCGEKITASEFYAAAKKVLKY